MAREPKISGCDSAAIFLMSLGEREAAKIMKHMDVAEVRKLSETMKNLGAVSRAQAERVISEFATTVSDQGPVTTASERFVHRMLSESIGDGQANPLVERLFPQQGSGLASLQLMESEEVVEAIQAEHPQVIAIALAALGKEKSAEVLTALPVALAADVIRRIARMEEISEAALEDLEQVMHQRFTQGDRHKAKHLGGIRNAAEILNRVGKSVEKAVLEELAATDEELSQQVQDNMLVFESLEVLDDRGMQTLLRDIDSQSLVIALKGASPAFKNLVFRNMSKRAAELLKSDLEAKGPMKLSEVEVAQKAIVEKARALADDGKINLGSGDDEFV